MADLKDRNNDHMRRMEQIKIKLEVIDSGAKDCDGYTSNSEETTFIVTFT